jgi:hypothetical protein
MPRLLPRGEARSGRSKACVGDGWSAVATRPIDTFWCLCVSFLPKQSNYDDTSESLELGNVF